MSLTDFEDRDWSYGAEPPTPSMRGEEFLAFVTELADGHSVRMDHRWRNEVRDARWKLAGVDTTDMVLFAYLVAGYLLSESYGIPYPEDMEKMLAVPSGYLHRVMYRRCGHEWHNIIKAGKFYRAGVPAELVIAAKGSLSDVHSAGEWMSDEVLYFHEQGVTAEYVEATEGILCTAPHLARMYHAGVPADYAMALSNVAGSKPWDSFQGMKPKRIIELWETGVCIEYASA